MKYLYIVGSCGSIGTQTLDIVRDNPSDYKVIGMSVGSNLELAEKLINEFKPEIVCFRYEKHIQLTHLEYNPVIVFGDSGLLDIAKYHKYDNEVFDSEERVKRIKRLLVTKEGKTSFGEDAEINVLIKKYEEELNGDGRILIRASGTENLIRVMIEGKNTEEISRMANDIADLINKKFGI